MNAYLLINIGMFFSLAIAGTLVLFYLRYRRRITQQQIQLQENKLKHQQELLHAVITSQEKERERIGRDLHDDVGTALSNLRLTMDRFATQTISHPNMADFNIQCKTTIDKIVTDVRNISHNLSPSSLSLYGFVDAIEELTDNVNQSDKLIVSFHNNATGTLQQLDHTTALSLYRVLEELINNTIRHAHAKDAVISFYTDDNTLHLQYKDNGIGINNSTNKKGMGLQNIESRLGMIYATYSMPVTEKGFLINIELPLNSKP